MMRSNLILANRDSRDELGVEVALALGQGIAKTETSGDRDGPRALYIRMKRNRKKKKRNRKYELTVRQTCSVFTLLQLWRKHE